MKYKKQISLILGLLAITSSASFATVTMNTQFGVATATSAAAVPDGTLWALIVDNGDNTLPGGLALNSGLNSSVNSSVVSAFNGVNFTLGTVFGGAGGDTVFALGAFNGTGVLGVAGSTSNSVAGLTLGVNGLVAARNFAFYFFPGVTFTTQSATYTANGQVGGMNSTSADAGAGTGPMVIPSEGATTNPGASTFAGGDLGGSTPDATFRAVAISAAIPEPSAALLGAIGVLGLLRRRRN